MELALTAAAFVMQYALLPMGVGPLHRNRIVFFSYFGKQYSCNPKYLSEYLEHNHPNVELVWAFEDPERFSFLRERGVRLVRINTPEFVRACLTARYVVTNSELPAWLPVSHRQTIINTWHGGGAYKLVGAHYNKGSLGKNLRSAIGRRKPVVYLSSSRAFTRLTLRQSFEHHGEVLEFGMPRNDMLVRYGAGERDERLVRRVRERLGIREHDHILLYAPTFREDRAASTYLFDFDRATSALRERFGGTWTVLVRMHYLVMRQLTNDGSYVDASAYPDMQELLYAADVLVTDYSSSIWDFGLTRKPCFLYVPDLTDYDAEHGFYSNIHTWPWSLAQTNDELAQAIRDFDEAAYVERLAQHYADLGSTETGHACKNVAARLIARA